MLFFVEQSKHCDHPFVLGFALAGCSLLSKVNTAYRSVLGFALAERKTKYK